MKWIGYLIFLISLITMSSCRDFDKSTYNFFTEEEISEIFINLDSAMQLQTRIEKLENYDEYVGANNRYSEVDTAIFVNEHGETIKSLCTSSIEVQLIPSSFFYPSSSDSWLGSSFTAIDNCFINSLTFALIKSSSRESIRRDVYFSSHDSLIDNDSIGYILSYEPFIWDGEWIENCVKIKGYDKASKEVFKMVYSNKQGFLQIRCRDKEITRKKE